MQKSSSHFSEFFPLPDYFPVKNLPPLQAGLTEKEHSETLTQLKELILNPKKHFKFLEACYLASIHDREWFQRNKKSIDLEGKRYSSVSKLKEDNIKDPEAFKHVLAKKRRTYRIEDLRALVLDGKTVAEIKMKRREECLSIFYALLKTIRDNKMTNALADLSQFFQNSNIASCILDDTLSLTPDQEDEVINALVSSKVFENFTKKLSFELNEDHYYIPFKYSVCETEKFCKENVDFLKKIIDILPAAALMPFLPPNITFWFPDLFQSLTLLEYIKYALIEREDAIALYLSSFPDFIPCITTTLEEYQMQVDLLTSFDSDCDVAIENCGIQVSDLNEKEEEPEGKGKEKCPDVEPREPIVFVEKNFEDIAIRFANDIQEIERIENMEEALQQLTTAALHLEEAPNLIPIVAELLKNSSFSPEKLLTFLEYYPELAILGELITKN